MSQLMIYHNPRCSKSRATLALLERHGADHQIVEYLQNPPSAATLRALLIKPDITPRELMRGRQAPYTEPGLARADGNTLVDAMVAHPVLIERPIVEAQTRASIGRPPENVLELPG